MYDREIDRSNPTIPTLTPARRHYMVDWVGERESALIDDDGRRVVCATGWFRELEPGWLMTVPMTDDGAPMWRLAERDDDERRRRLARVRGQLAALGPEPVTAGSEASGW